MDYRAVLVQTLPPDTLAAIEAACPNMDHQAFVQLMMAEGSVVVPIAKALLGILKPPSKP